MKGETIFYMTVFFILTIGVFGFIIYSEVSDLNCNNEDIITSGNVVTYIFEYKHPFVIKGGEDSFFIFSKSMYKNQSYLHIGELYKVYCYDNDTIEILNPISGEFIKEPDFEFYAKTTYLRPICGDSSKYCVYEEVSEQEVCYK